MALITKAIKGTKDVLPQDAYKIQYIEATARETAADFGYKEIRTPVFEHTELFQRGVGDTTDVVQKEMYTFDDKGGRPGIPGERAVQRGSAPKGLLSGQLLPVREAPGRSPAGVPPIRCGVLRHPIPPGRR